MRLLRRATQQSTKICVSFIRELQKKTFLQDLVPQGRIWAQTYLLVPQKMEFFFGSPNNTADNIIGASLNFYSERSLIAISLPRLPRTLEESSTW